MQSKNPVDIRQWLHDFVSTFESVLFKVAVYVTMIFAVCWGFTYFLQFQVTNGNPDRLVLAYVASITTLTTVISFIFNSGYFLPLLVWANICAMVSIYPSISVPQIFQLFCQFLQLIFLLVTRVSKHIVNSVKTQYSTIVKVVNKIKPDIEHCIIRYTHVRIITPSPASS